jgi:hypothetical protein
MLLLIAIVAATVVDFTVVVTAAGCVIKHLHPKLAIAFQLEVQETVNLLDVGAGELLPASVEEHLAFAAERHLDRPWAKAADGFPQVHVGRLPAGEILRELLWDPL